VTFKWTNISFQLKDVIHITISSDWNSIIISKKIFYLKNFPVGFLMWKEIDDNNADLKDPRASFMLGKKLIVGFRVHIYNVAQWLNCASDRANTNEEFQITSKCTEYLMRKHICQTI
jgi:hypothetical protein